MCHVTYTVAMHQWLLLSLSLSLSLFYRPPFNASTQPHKVAAEIGWRVRSSMPHSSVSLATATVGLNEDQVHSARTRATYLLANGMVCPTPAPLHYTQPRSVERGPPCEHCHARSIIQQQDFGPGEIVVGGGGGYCARAPAAARA
jgi:hypothetical protein